MGVNDDLAAQIIALYADLRKNSETVFLTYGELAKMLGRPGQHRLLGDPLDRVRKLCEQRGLPDVATCVVDQTSMLSGRLSPSPAAREKYGDWPELRSEQAKVLSFDWSKVQA